VLGKTRHPKILAGKLISPHASVFTRDLEALALVAARGDDMAVRRQLARMLPESQLTLIGTAARRDDSITEPILRSRATA
jgi:hypothetical protein